MRKIERPDCPNPVALTNGNYKHPDNKDALRRASFGKCMYCESKIDATYVGDVEHIKPKSKFPQSEFDWDNLGYSCYVCNNSKRDQYEIENPIINPYEDEPKDHFEPVGNLILPKLGDERSEVTIKVTDLNRVELRNRRDDVFYYVKSAAESALAAKSPTVRATRLKVLADYCGEDAIYSFFCEPLIRSYLECME